MLHQGTRYHSSQADKVCVPNVSQRGYCRAQILPNLQILLMLRYHWLLLGLMWTLLHWRCHFHSQTVLLTEGTLHYTTLHYTTHTHTHYDTNTHIYTCTHTCAHTYMCTHTHTHTHTHTYTLLHKYIHAHTHACAHTYMCTYTHAHTHISLKIHSFIRTSDSPCQ